MDLSKQPYRNFGDKPSMIMRFSNPHYTLFFLIIGALFGFFTAVVYFDSSDQLSLGQYRSVLETDVSVPQNGTDGEFIIPEPRIVCMVMTRPEMHEVKVVHIIRTWARRCDKIVLLTTENGANNTIGAIPLAVREGRDVLWQKAKLAFNYTYNHHLEDGDWFYKADDDTYAIMKNMRSFLKNYSSTDLVAIGYRLYTKPTPSITINYLSGGPGYIMSKAAFKKFVEDGLDPVKQICRQENSGNEDIYVGDCLEKVGVTLVHAMDEKQRPYFGVLSAKQTMFNGYIPEWYTNRSFVYPPLGTGAYPAKPIAFHYVKADEHYLLEAVENVE